MPGRAIGRQQRVAARAVGQPDVDERAGVVEPPPAERREPLGEPAYGGLVGEPDLGRPQPLTGVDVDAVGAVDHDVGHARQPQQRFERAGAEDVAAQLLVDRQHGRVADGPPGRAQRLGDPVRGELAGPVGQPLADLLDDDAQLDR